MLPDLPSNATAPAQPSPVPRRLAVPSWLLSMVFHLVLLIALALLFRLPAPRGAQGERTAEVGIALKRQEGDREFFVSESDTGDGATETTSAMGAGPSLNELLDDRPPTDPSEALPKALGVLGPGQLESGGVGDAGRAALGPSGRKGPLGGRATVRVFGTEGTGYKFVYVFDRSSSMGGSGRNALAAAKNELIKSLESLDTNHQFQIIFYNETPRQFNPSGRPGKLAFGNERNKRLATRFVGSIVADGATRHEEALKLAIRLGPDVIFFLTDADEPKLSPRQLAELHDWSGGITINAIEFGLGPASLGDNFLKRLARQNGGQYSYIDISRAVSRGK